jgi:hypothetical protein
MLNRTCEYFAVIAARRLMTNNQLLARSAQQIIILYLIGHKGFGFADGHIHLLGRVWGLHRLPLGI